MNVKDLIEELGGYDGDLEVIVLQQSDRTHRDIVWTEDGESLGSPVVILEVS